MFRKLRFARQRAATIVAGMAVASVVFAACDERNAPPASAATQRAAHDSAEAAGEVSIADTTARPADAVWITDAGALAMLSAMNARQIAAAEVELEAWHTDTVRAFASQIAHDHAAFQRHIDSVVTRIHIAPVMSALGQRVDSAFRRRVDSLRALSGASLERALPPAQVASEQALAQYADQLAGAATAPEVEALMESAGNFARAEVSRARGFVAARVIADSTKAAAVADSLAKVEARHRRTRPPP